MKYTDKDIIERFQKFDFDANGAKQAEVLNRVKTPAKKSYRPGRKLAFAASFCVVLLAGIFVSKNMLPEIMDSTKQKILGGSGTVEIDEYFGLTVEQLRVAELAAPPQGNSAVLVKGESKATPAQAPVYKEASASNKAVAAHRFQTSVAEPERRVEDMRLTKLSTYAAGGSMVKARHPAPMGIIAAQTAYVDYNAMQDEDYAKYVENTFFSTATDPLSTFSTDVDTASYSMVKRDIQSGRRINPDAVRIEEFINYFDYNYPQPTGSDPVSINMEYTDSPWNKGLKLVKIGLKAKDIEKAKLPASNLVFLVDVSGSMASDNRLPLVKKALRMLVDELRAEDSVSIVTYADGTNEVLSGVKGSNKEKILTAIDALNASGGTYGAGGLEKAYEAAKKNFIRKGNNRVILATDGDFNIGPRSNAELEEQITKAKDSGVFLSVLGFGMGNYKDSKVQTLANKGNGNYAYINDLFEARKVLVKEFGATLFTVAKDVKVQVEFNPANVAAYRLVGYEKRKLENQDFNDDKKDAAEMGAGHTVTILYEVIPVDVKSELAPDIDTLKYAKKSDGIGSGELLTVKIRYKEPSSDKSKLMEKELDANSYVAFDKSSDDMRFAASVAQFGQILKGSQYKGDMTVKQVLDTAKKAKGTDDEGYRAEFIRIVDLSQANL
ncbi:Ca-activated chloride channel family protein [Elusimicrobium simillimum]|uniref:vWA domain-containing protein n=1 Tax=Elusimicrobium simillimum TaxID=3143438 RepID=UPI003C6FAA4E